MKQFFFLKPLSLILACVLLIFSLAWLPALVVHWQERTLLPAYAPVVQVSLALEPEPDAASIPLALNLLCQNTSFSEIPEAVASQSRRLIESNFHTTLDAYIQAGLVPSPPDDANAVFQTYLIFEPIWSLSAVFWQVRLTGTDWSFCLTIDDSSGRVCAVSYSGDTGALSVTEDTLQTFSRLYLDNLGPIVSQWEVSDITHAVTADGVPMVYGYTNWGDLYYGECRITFRVDSSGFSTQLGTREMMPF